MVFSADSTQTWVCGARPNNECRSQLKLLPIRSGGLQIPKDRYRSLSDSLEQNSRMFRLCSRPDISRRMHHLHRCRQRTSRVPLGKKVVQKNAGWILFSVSLPALERKMNFVNFHVWHYNAPVKSA